MRPVRGHQRMSRMPAVFAMDAVSAWPPACSVFIQHLDT